LHTSGLQKAALYAIFLDPEAGQVLVKVIYEPDVVKRAHALADALDEVKAKRNPVPDAPRNSLFRPQYSWPISSRTPTPLIFQPG
jgi:hypothetical protein